jgi:hypothetical protein
MMAGWRTTHIMVDQFITPLDEIGPHSHLCKTRTDNPAYSSLLLEQRVQHTQELPKWSEVSMQTLEMVTHWRRE